jgi:glycosyltransferase involved in cell wall biosynthesis
MKVGVFTSYFGGPYQWGRDLCTALANRGVDTYQVCSPASRMVNLLWSRCDVVHTTIPFPTLFHKPMVVTVKGDFTIERNVLQKFYPALLNRASAITTPSQYLKDRLHREYIQVIPNAVFPERFTVAPHVDRSRLNVVTVMNFYFAGKSIGLTKIIDILERHKSVQYIVVGDGPYLERAKEYAKNKDIDIRFSGFIENPQLALSNSDLFLYYSNHDNFPNAIVEAMACGLPVLTNQVGAVSEIIENGVDGFVTESDSEYEAILGRLVTDAGLRHRIGAAARRKVERNMNWNTLVDKYIDIYERVLGKSIQPIKK